MSGANPEDGRRGRETTRPDLLCDSERKLALACWLAPVFALILAFPDGRISGAVRWHARWAVVVCFGGTVGVLALAVLANLLAPGLTGAAIVYPGAGIVALVAVNLLAVVRGRGPFFRNPSGAPANRRS